MLFLIILIFSLISGFLLPWWVVAIIAFFAAWFLGKTSGKSFGAGFLAVAIAWAILALIKSIPNENELATRVAMLFNLPAWWFLMVLITAIIGGLVGGMAAWSGVLFKKVFAKKG